MEPDTPDLSPFADAPSFRFAVLAHKKVQASVTELNDLLSIWAEYNSIYDGPEPPFHNVDDLYKTIDSIQHGDAPWESFTVRYDGPLDANSPAWKRRDYTVYCRNTSTMAHNMLANIAFKDQFDYVPYKEVDAKGNRVYSNLMSGQWAYKKAVSSTNTSCLFHKPNYIYSL